MYDTIRRYTYLTRTLLPVWGGQTPAVLHLELLIQSDTLRSKKMIFGRTIWLVRCFLNQVQVW